MSINSYNTMFQLKKKKKFGENYGNLVTNFYWNLGFSVATAIKRQLVPCITSLILYNVSIFFK